MNTLVILSGNGGNRYINLEYQKRFLDIKKIINSNDFENIIILGREQELTEVEILSALIKSEGISKSKIITINDYKSTYNNILTIVGMLNEKNIKGVNLVTSPYHTLRTKMIWKKHSNIDLNIIENLDNPLNYKYGSKILSYEKIKVVFYEFRSMVYSRLQGYSD